MKIIKIKRIDKVDEEPSPKSSSRKTLKIALLVIGFIVIVACLLLFAWYFHQTEAFE